MYLKTLPLNPLNYNACALAFAMQFNRVVANKVLLRSGKRNVQFSRVIFEINPLFKIRGHILIFDFWKKYMRIYQTLNMRNS